MTISVSTTADSGQQKGAKVSPSSFVSGLRQLLPDLDATVYSPEAIAYLDGLRDYASLRLHELTFPSTRDEEWRFTDLSPLLDLSLRAPTVLPLHQVDGSTIALPEALQSRLVFVNGFYAPSLSSVAGVSSRVLLAPLSQALQDPAMVGRLRHVLAKQPENNDLFASLNTAGLRDGAVLWIPQHCAVDVPIHLLFLTLPQAEQSVFSQSRCLVIAEAGSQVTIVEEHRCAVPSADLSHADLTNSVTEIWVSENTAVTHTRLQQESDIAFHIGRTVVTQERDSRYTCNAISTGAVISRHNLDIYQAGPQTYTELNGLTMIGDRQLADTHSAIAFSHPYGSSRQVHKCIVDDQARAVFNGKIFVPKPAQLTDASQLSRTLLLSPRARIDTKPQLEITADNVKCSHGATVSQLEADEIFYLQSRGLDRMTAQNLLVFAFAVEVIDRIALPSLRQRLTADLKLKTHGTSFP